MGEGKHEQSSAAQEQQAGLSLCEAAAFEKLCKVKKINLDLKKKKAIKTRTSR